MSDSTLAMQHFISLADHDTATLQHALDVAFELRAQRDNGNEPLLKGKTLCLVFEKPSLRTRVSFEQ